MPSVSMGQCNRLLVAGVAGDGVVLPTESLLSSEQFEMLWSLRAAGLPLSRVAHRIGRQRPGIYLYVQKCGGVRPAVRSRAADRLTLDQREEISRGLSAGLTVRAIAAAMSPARSPSTVSREVMRNGGRVKYRAVLADRRAWREARRPK